MLNDCPILTTRNFEATREFLANKGLLCRIDTRNICEAEQHYYARINAIYGESIYLAYMSYGADLEIESSAERADYGFSVSYRGQMISRIGDDKIACTKSRTILASPGYPQTMSMRGGSQRLALSIQQSAIRKQLALLVGEEVTAPLQFATDFDLTGGPGRAILAQMELLVERQDAGLQVFAQPLLQTHFEETVLSTLLLFHPHNLQSLLQRPARRGAKSDIKRVVDYMHANLAKSITLNELVSVAGIPGRTLNEHFRSVFGCSPMSYLRRLRLHAAREILQTGAQLKVTDVAMRFGFLHLGRFSSAYKQAFGELPGQTLQKARRQI